MEHADCAATYRIGQVALMQRHQLVGVVHQRSVGSALAQACRDDARLLAQLGEAGVPDAPEAAHVPKLHYTRVAQLQGASAAFSPVRDLICMPACQMLFMSPHCIYRGLSPCKCSAQAQPTLTSGQLTSGREFLSASLT